MCREDFRTARSLPFSIFLRFWDSRDSFIAQKWPACNFTSRRFDEFSCEIPGFSWLTDSPSELFLCCCLRVYIRVFWLCFQTIPLSHFHCCNAFEGCDLTTKPTAVASLKLQTPQSNDCINFCFYLSKAFKITWEGEKFSMCQTSCCYVTKGFPPIHGGQRRHDSRWGDPKPLPGHMSPSLRLAGPSQGTLSPTGETAGEDLPSTSRLSRTQGNSNLGLHKLTGCYGEEPKVAKGRNDSSLRNNECGKIRG